MTWMDDLSGRNVDPLFSKMNKEGGSKILATGMNAVQVKGN